MKAAVLFSGGKDSTMAIYKAIEQGYEVVYLVSMISNNPESYMFHVPNIHITELSSEAMGIPLIKAKTHGVKEEELDDLKKVLNELKDRGVRAIFTGALASEYQKSRIDQLCTDLGLVSNAPLWHVDPKEYMEEIIDLGFEVIIISVSAEGLEESWLGRKIDHELLDELIILNNKYGMHMAFEGGEAETLVLDCPIFKRRINILASSKVWDRDNGYLSITEAELENK
ncbi:MAG: TIGR00289 family protein [Methanobacterium sp.]